MESIPYLHCGSNSASLISIDADILHFFTYFELFNKILDHGISKQIQKIAQFFLHSLNEFSELLILLHEIDKTDKEEKFHHFANVKV